MPERQEEGFYKTRRALLGTHILNEPLFTVYNFIPFLLYRDLQATAILVTALTMLKPLVSVISLYWSQFAFNRRSKLLDNVIIANVAGRIPFLFFPWIHDPKIIVLCAAFYMLTYRASIPAWMEVLKLNLKEQRGRLFSLGSALGYGEGVLLAVAIGKVLDMDVSAWRWIFPASAIVGLLGVLMQRGLPLPAAKEEAETDVSLWERFAGPWKCTWKLMTERPDFRRFQWGIMLCASGLMIIQPALPIFFVDYLHITYTELAIALSVCKGLGYCVTSSAWGKRFHDVSIFNFTAAACFTVGLFPLLLIFAQWNIAFLYLAYFLYGIGQAGCHLNWNMSGTVFAANEDSSTFTSVNVVTVGIRGALIPPLGHFLCGAMNPLLPLVLSVGLCWASGLYSMEKEKQPKLA